ncbi:MAG: hypothetical protein AAFX06_05200 [Planctomycetota bacterium]
MRTRFSIRFLFGLTLVGAVVLCFVHHWYVNPSQQQLVKELNAYGANPLLSDGSDLCVLTRLPAGELKVRHLGAPPHLICAGLIFDHVDSSRPLFLASRITSATDLRIERVESNVTPRGCDFSHLQDLSLSGVNTSQLKDWLRAADRLETLSLVGPQGDSDDILEIVASHPSLSEIRLRNTGVSTKGLRVLSRLSTLHCLVMFDCPLEQEALEELVRHQNLRELHLCGEMYGDQTVRSATQLKQLESLEIIGTSLTDDGVKMICEMPNLYYVNLKYCPRTTSACLPDLIAMKERLQSLGGALICDRSIGDD